MYKPLRLILIATVLLVGYLAALVIYLVPYAWLILVGLGIFALGKRTYHYTAYGTARWAEPQDLEDMIDG